MTIFEFKAHIRRVITTKVGDKTKLVCDISEAARKAIQKVITTSDEPTPFSDNDGEVVTWVTVKDINDHKELEVGTDLNLNVVMQARLQHWKMVGKQGWGLYLISYTVSSAPSNTVVRLDGLDGSTSSSSSSSSATPKRKVAAAREPPKAPKKPRQPSLSHNKTSSSSSSSSSSSGNKTTPLSSRKLDQEFEEEEWTRSGMSDEDDSHPSFTQSALNIDLPSP